MGRLAARRSEITAINVFVKRKEGRKAENKAHADVATLNDDAIFSAAANSQPQATMKKVQYRTQTMSFDK